MFNFLGLLKWSWVVDLVYRFSLIFLKSASWVIATLISVQCFFLILICPEHKVFPCEVIYMIVSFYSLRGPHPISSGAKRFFILVQVLFYYSVGMC
jgi:hypothetical protein